MGHIWVKVRLGDPNQTRVVEVNALVNTSATLTVIPRKIASELNLKRSPPTVTFH